MKLIFVWLLAIVFLIDSVLRAIRSSFNLGVLMMYLITAALWIYALFHTKIDAFCAAGAGRVLKHLFLLLRRFCAAAYIRRGERLLRHRDQTGKSGDRTGRRPARRTRDRPFGTPSGCRI